MYNFITNFFPQFVFLIVLFGLAAFFSASETALIAISRVRVKKLVTEQPGKSKGFRLWLEDPNKLLTTLLTSLNTVAILSSAVATSMAIKISREYSLNEATAISVSAACVTVIIIIFGEVSPKLFAIRNAEKLGTFAIMPLYYLDRLLTPFTRIFVWIGGNIAGVSGEKSIPVMTAEDVKTMISVGQEVGILSLETKQMMHSVFNFPQITAKSIMTSREKMDMVDIDVEKEKFIDLLIEQGHSRVPVYRGEIDNVIGVVHMRDLLGFWRSGSVFAVDDLVRPVIFVNEEEKVNEIMRNFKKGESHLAIVRNSHKKVVGLITMEDVEEEIFGEILDEYDLEDLFRD